MRFNNLSDLGRLAVIIAPLLLSTLVSSAESLENKSPFLPPDHDKPKVVAPPPVQSNGPLSREIEFRGVVQMDDIYQISLFNKSEQKGYWIKVGEQKEGIGVTAFDLDSMAVTLNQNGRSERLTLLESNDSPLPVAVSARQPQANKNTNRPTLPSGVQNTTNNSSTTKRTIPRRRVILPRK